MIIVSQDKRKTTENLDLTIFDYTVKCDEIPKTITRFQILDGNSKVLGEYKTEGRAKGILQDIVFRYEAIELCKNKSADDLGYTFADYTPIYYMPKE